MVCNFTNMLLKRRLSRCRAKRSSGESSPAIIQRERAVAPDATGVSGAAELAGIRDWPQMNTDECRKRRMPSRLAGPLVATTGIWLIARTRMSERHWQRNAAVGSIFAARRGGK